MSQQAPESAIRRILVALDASPCSLAALGAAAELATELRAELQGLFVEETSLLQMAGAPYAQEMGFFTASPRPLSRAGIERQLRAQARRARQAMARAAERLQVPWTFRVVRGTTATELLTAASDVDLVILGKRGWQSVQRRRLGSTVRTVVSQSSCLTLVLEHGARLAVPITAIYDGSAPAHRALEAAYRLARDKGGHLTVLILADDPDAARRLQREAVQRLPPRVPAPRFRWVLQGNGERLVHTILSEGCGALVLATEGSQLEQGTILKLLDSINCPVFLVR